MKNQLNIEDAIVSMKSIIQRLADAYLEELNSIVVLKDNQIPDHETGAGRIAKR